MNTVEQQMLDNISYWPQTEIIATACAKVAEDVAIEYGEWIAKAAIKGIQPMGMTGITTNKQTYDWFINNVYGK